MSVSMEEELRAYTAELKVSSLSLTQLINSHRNLRTDAQKTNAERLAEMQKSREIAATQAIAEVKELGWFSVERLRGMTLAQIAELIRKD